MVFLADFNDAVSSMLKDKKFNFLGSFELKADQKAVFSWSAKQSLGKDRAKSELTLKQVEPGLAEIKCTFKNPADMSLEASTKDLAPLNNASVKVEEGLFEASATYEQDSYAAEVTFVNKRSMCLKPTVSFVPMDHWTVGADAVLSENGLDNYGVGVYYCSKTDQKLSVQLADQMKKVTVGGYLRQTELGKIGAQVEVTDFENPKIEAKAGGLMKLDDRAKLRWRVGASKPDLSLVYEYQFRDNLKGSFSTNYDFGKHCLGPLGYKFEVEV